MSCSCGNRVDFSFQRLSCIDCGASCCPSCAVALESVSYCRGCATSLLGAAPAECDGFDLY
jgi:hypothetical protein